jgi:hypothetical protein
MKRKISNFILKYFSIILALIFSINFVQIIIADELEKYKVKREEKFDFDVKPSVLKHENSYLISFTTKNYCDVSICVVNNEDKILRHIASGVLGDNAPAPFAKNSFKQEIKWDLKDDQGNYLKDLDNIKIQVSLGLKPEFERTLYWDPQKKLSYETPVIKATKEGVLVYNGAGVDHLLMYTHDGVYSKTIYPYQSDNLKNISDMLWQEFPQVGKVPKKHSFLMQTLLTSGNNAPDIMNIAEKDNAMHGTAATTIGVFGNKVALIKKSINRLTLNTEEEKFKKNGPIVTNFTAVNPNTPFYGPPLGDIYPKSVAFSPDGKWLYMSGYYHNIGDPAGADYNCLHGVTRIAYEKQDSLEIFLGKMSEKTDRYNNMKDAGDDNEHFTCATSVACDKEGRIYVADYMNQRIQIFTPEGKFLKSIKTEYPAKIQIHPETNEIYVFSLLIRNPKITYELLKNFNPCLMVYGSFANPNLKNKYEMPYLKSGSIAGTRGGLEGSSVQVELDLWLDQPKLWVCTATSLFYSFDKKAFNSEGVGISIYQLKDNKWEVQTKFEDSIKANLGAVRNPNDFPQVQNLYVNQQTGLLYIGEPDTVQNFSTLVEVNPFSGKCKTIPLPFQTVEMGFDLRLMEKILYPI